MEPSGLPLLEQPFHDHGPVCVPHPPTARGERVRVRAWVPDSYRIKSVSLRQYLDAEPLVTACVKAESDGAGHWYEGEVLAHNPLTRYRFALVGEADSPVPYAWLNAAGLWPYDVSDSRDFTLVAHEAPPAWVADAVVYQIFPDRFARAASSGPVFEADVPEWATPMAWEDPCAEDGHTNGHQLFGGDLAGIEERLEYIQSLGATTIYLTPIFPAGSVHRYDASTFDEVDPLLGGDEALASLSAAIHARGMRLILDLTTNHTGNHHRWFERAQADAASDEATYYTFLEHPDKYVSWLGVPSLPKLNHEAPAMRAALYEGPGSITARWLAEPYSADGWRIDVANMTGRYGAVDLAHDVARRMRRTMGPEHWLIAEHGHDATRDLDGDGWHGTMNYVGFTRPMWAWLTKDSSDINWLGLPMGVPRLGTEGTAHTLREYNAEMPWPARLHSQNQLCSHDTARIRTVVGTPGRHAVALGALVGLPGVPTLFAGDELGLEGLNGEHARTPMPWHQIDAGDLAPEQEAWRDLTRRALTARAASPALRRGGLRYVHVGGESLTFVRTHPDGSVLVHLARDAHAPIALATDALLGSPAEDLAPLCAAGDVSVSSAPGTVTLTATGPGFTILPLNA